MDSNHRRRKPADLQSAPVGHLGNLPHRNRRRLCLRRAAEYAEARSGGKPLFPSPGQNVAAPQLLRRPRHTGRTPPADSRHAARQNCSHETWDVPAPAVVPRALAARLCLGVWRDVTPGSPVGRVAVGRSDPGSPRPILRPRNPSPRRSRPTTPPVSSWTGSSSPCIRSHGAGTEKAGVCGAARSCPIWTKRSEWGCAGRSCLFTGARWSRRDRLI